MFDTENPQPTDPPENTGGGTTASASPDSSEAQLATDPPENTGGGTK